MLVKWAIEGRRKGAKASPSKTVEDRHSDASAPAPSRGPPGARGAQTRDAPQIAQHPGASETPAQSPSLTAELDRLRYERSAALAKSSETADDRAMRRIHAEEKASSLRDDKLLSLTGMGIGTGTGTDGSGGGGSGQGSYHSQGEQQSQSQLPLTQENMQKLEQEAEPAVFRRPTDVVGDVVGDGRSSGGDVDFDVEPQSESRSDSRTGSLRPSLKAVQAHMESQQTVTGQASR